MKPIFTGRKIAYLLSLSAILTFLLPLALNAFPAAARQSSFFKNVFFVNITFMGDALFAFALAFVLLFFFDKKDMSLRLLLTLMVSLTLIQFIKNILSPLPAQIYFEAGNPGAVSYKNLLSSHAALAFTLGGFFAMHAKRFLYRAVLFTLAAVIAYSRMPLAGESPETIAFGLLPAIIAVWFAHRISFYRRVKTTTYYYRKRRTRHADTGHFSPA